MAIARIKATPSWFEAAAALLESTQPKGARELLRAVDRPGKTAELHDDEVRQLATLLPNDERARQALVDLEQALEGELRRTRSLHAMLERRRAGNSD